jgi:hypothetical protein
MGASYGCSTWEAGAPERASYLGEVTAITSDAHNGTTNLTRINLEPLQEKVRWAENGRRGLRKNE